MNMEVCPLDFRYGREEVKEIFNRISRLKKYLQVEAAMARAQAHAGIIPERAGEEIDRAVKENRVSLDRVEEIESEIKHDVMALVLALSEVCGDAGKYVHLGATSYDIVDTATALQLKEFNAILREDLIELRDVLLDLANRHRHTLMVGRTHGQHALPLTLGFKMAVYAAEIQRHLERLSQMEDRVLVGKMSGAVGTMASFGDRGLEIEAQVMNALGLRAEIASTQIVQRDRLVEYISFIANIATSLEKFATEIRNLQRTEIGEVSEPFDHERQVGSSTMPQKRNPIVCENVSGLARVIRALLIPAMENAIQWHERDLANSSGERIIIPHACVLIDDMLNKMIRVFKNLAIDSERMKKNLEMTGGRIMAEAVIMALVERGMERNVAYQIVRKTALKSGNFAHLLSGVPEISALLREDEIEDLLKPENYLGQSDAIIDRVTSYIRGG